MTVPVLTPILITARTQLGLDRVRLSKAAASSKTGPVSRVRQAFVSAGGKHGNDVREPDAGVSVYRPEGELGPSIVVLPIP